MVERSSFFLAEAVAATGAAAGIGDFLHTDIWVSTVVECTAKSSTSDVSVSISWDPREMYVVMDTA